METTGWGAQCEAKLVSLKNQLAENKTERGPILMPSNTARGMTEGEIGVQHTVLNTPHRWQASEASRRASSS